MEKIRRKFSIAALLFISSCASENSSNLKFGSEKLIRGNSWSMKVPDRGWWFIHKGGQSQTMLFGASEQNFGSRPMLVQLTNACSNPVEPKFSDCVSNENQCQKNIGYATKWAGSKLAELQAFETDSSVVYLMKTRVGECVWEFRCEGDRARSNAVRSICNSMVSTFEVVQ